MTADRYPNGEVKHESEFDARRTARGQRLSDLAKMLDDPRLGSELGRLHWHGKIFQTQYDAGNEWAETVARCRRLKLSQSGHPKVSSPERVSKSESGYEPTPEAIKAAETRYDDLFCAVVDRINGVAMMKVLNSVCVDNQPPTYPELILLKGALDILAAKLGLTGVANYGRPPIQEIH